MEGIDDPKNIIGMADILADDNEDIDLDEIERSISKNTFVKKEDDIVDLADQYTKEIEDISKHFDTDNKQEYKSSTSYSYTNIQDRYDSNETGNPPVLEVIDEDEDEDDEIIKPNKSWSPSSPNDRQLYSMTNEEKKQSHISSVLKNVETPQDDIDFIEEEEEEDERARLFEQIDLLKSNLESEGINLERIPNVNNSTSKKEARSILKILQIKNDRLRYCDMFEEGILAVAYGLETVFDGKKEWFGTKIDLVGWPETVKVKLRRMRYDTSSFVSDVMKGYNAGHGWRIIFELLPSLFLYSRDRRLRSNDNLISDSAYKNALNDLQN